MKVSDINKDAISKEVPLWSYLVQLPRTADFVYMFLNLLLKVTGYRWAFALPFNRVFVLIRSEASTLHFFVKEVLPY